MQREVELAALERAVPGFLRRPSGKPHACYEGKNAIELARLYSVEMLIDQPPIDQVPRQAAATYRTSQGFDVRSKAERSIAELLFQWKIECHYETEIPPDRRLKCDFFLPQHDVYVEYWGTPDDPAYRRRMDEKKELYRREGLRLIELYPKDERDLAAAPSRELRKYGIRFDADSKPSPGIFAWLSRIGKWLFGRK